MSHRAKLDLDYKTLHTVGKQVIKLNMTDTLTQEDSGILGKMFLYATDWLYMRRRSKLNFDYKILYTSGKKVIKINMTEKLIQEDLEISG